MTAVRMFTVLNGISWLLILDKSRSAAVLPISKLGMFTVVRLGSIIFDSVELSKPQTKTSLGTEILIDLRAAIKFIAIKSLAQIKASGSSGSSFILFPSHAESW